MASLLKHVKRVSLVVVLILLVLVVVNYRDQLVKIAKPIGGFLGDVYSSLTIEEKREEVSDIMDEYLGVAKDGAVRTVILHGDEETYQVDAELAMTADSQARGLMYRESLCDSCGMLFVYELDTDDGYWMKNCKIPLDVIFVSASGVIVDIKENFQPCEEDPCPSYVPIKEYRRVLEVNGGWCEEHGVQVGNAVEIPSLD